MLGNSSFFNKISNSYKVRQEYLTVLVAPWAAKCPSVECTSTRIQGRVAAVSLGMLSQPAHLGLIGVTPVCLPSGAVHATRALPVLFVMSCRVMSWLTSRVPLCIAGVGCRWRIGRKPQIVDVVYSKMIWQCLRVRITVAVAVYGCCYPHCSQLLPGLASPLSPASMITLSRLYGCIVCFWLDDGRWCPVTGGSDLVGAQSGTNGVVWLRAE